MKQPKPTYRIIAKGDPPKRENPKESQDVFPWTSFRFGPSRILSLSAGHPTACGKFVMDKYIKAKNMQKIFISGFPSFQIPSFPKRLIIDKEADILSLRLKDFLSKNQGEILEPLSVN